MSTEIQITTVQTKYAFSLIETNKDKISQILPKGMGVLQFMANMNAVIQQNPDLATCTAPSLLGAMLHAAKLGLKPGVMNQAYLIPYFNSKKNCREAQIIIGYEGLRDLAMRSGMIDNIQSHLVYERDFFEVSLGGESKITHRPIFFGDRGALIGVYAIALNKSGSHQFEVMSKEEVDLLAKTSKSQAIWQKYYGEMARKTVIRKLCKHLPKSTEHLSVALELENGADADEGQRVESLLSESGITYETPLTVPQEDKFLQVRAVAERMLELLPNDAVKDCFGLTREEVQAKLTSQLQCERAILRMKEKK